MGDTWGDRKLMPKLVTSEFSNQGVHAVKLVHEELAAQISSGVPAWEARLMKYENFL